MPELHTLLTGLAFGESPRWHDGRLWVADWGAQEILAVALEGKREVIVKVSFPSFPMCFDWLPDGHLLLVSSRDGLLLRMEPGGSLVTHADLSGLSKQGLPWNEIVIDGRGNAYLNNQGFDFPGGAFAPGTIALLTPNGTPRLVADGIAFPNGMAVTPDNSTLIVAESYGNRLTAFAIEASGSLSHRRVWAEGWPCGAGEIEESGSSFSMPCDTRARERNDRSPEQPPRSGADCPSESNHETKRSTTAEQVGRSPRAPRLLPRLRPDAG